MRNLKKKVYFLFFLSASLFLVIFMTTCLVIGIQVNTICDNAKKLYLKSDCVIALSILLEDNNQGFKTRNQAIWALGQLGDKSALVVLQKY